MAGQSLGALIPKDTCARGEARRDERPYRCAIHKVHICVGCPAICASLVLSSWKSPSYLVPKPLKVPLPQNGPGAAPRPGFLGMKSPRKENEGLKKEGHPPAGSEMRGSDGEGRGLNQGSRGQSAWLFLLKWKKGRGLAEPGRHLWAAPGRCGACAGRPRAARGRAG